MLTYRFPQHVSACMVGAQAIFLDARQDRYLSLGGVAAQAVQALLEHRAADEDQLRRLEKAGLVEAGEPQPGWPRRPAAPTHSLVEDDGIQATSGLTSLVEVAAGLFQAGRHVRRRPLASILDSIGARKTNPSRPLETSTQSILPLAAAYLATRRRVPIQPSCLPDALALLTCLARRRLTADLVFGVKLNPFSAHCWVQAGDIVLNDAIGTVTVHTPILVV